MMAGLEGLFIWTAIGLYALSFIAGLYSVIFKKGSGAGQWFLRGAVLAHCIAIGVRWYSTGHPPVMGVYENSLMGSCFISLTYIILQYYFKQIEGVYILVSPVVLLILGNGLQSPAELAPLEPPYRSNWLYVHVLFAWLAFGSYFVSAFVGAITIIREGITKRFSFRIPEEKYLDELSFRLILFGFFSESIMIGSGAIWAHGLWGRYWGWDPVETWSLISWLTYGLNLHLRLTYGWRGKRAAWLAIVSLFGVIGLFFGIGYISGLHTRMLD
jgi:cytochrome c-type biogenesis protein CcsB